MSTIADARLLECLRLDADRVARTDVSALDNPVPWCGAWRIEDLIGHLGSVHRWATALSSAPGTWVKRRDMESPPTGPDVLAWYADGLEPMRRALDGVDLDVAVKTWAGDQPRRWWLRRLAHETAVHRWDATAAATPDDVTPVEADLAIDGIDELFEFFLPLFADKLAGPDATMHLHATDGDGEWLVTFGPTGIDVAREHAKGDVAVRAPASELLLLIWNRRGPDDLAGEVFGDVAVVERWQAVAHL
jgi:uncharacterized protein (TIGR03083 family)